MGVKSCNRKGCESIMCDTYVDGVGYVCNGCQNEFKEYTESKNIDVSTEGKIKRELSVFIDTEKGSYDKGKEISIDQFFNQYTGD
jgi:hypothetical protein